MVYHCSFCQCPKEVWKPCIANYQGDECQLYDSFSSLIEDWMTAEDLTAVVIAELPKEYSDIKDITALAKELVVIAIECGVLESKSI